MYNILSLDGGGSWAMLQLLTLKERYKNRPGITGHEILRDFDLLIANSGGSIVLAALAENWTLDKALSLFDDRHTREKIFSKNSFSERFFPVDYLRLFTSFGPKYSSKRKGEALAEVFPEISKRQMRELPEFIGKESLRMVVCTYDALNNRAKFFKSYPAGGESISLTKAVNGSSNAPIQYFDFPVRFKADGSEIFYELWDGALGGFNNPVLAGVIEAFKLGIPLNTIKIVSLGNGNKLMSMKEKEEFFDLKLTTQKERTKKLWLNRLKFQMRYFGKTVLNQAKTILYEPPDWATYVAMMFLAKDGAEDISERFIRLSPMVHFDKNTPEGSIGLINKLYDLDMDLTRDEDLKLIKDCFNHWKAGHIKNQPLQYEVTRNNELICHGGHCYFEEAMSGWLKNNPDQAPQTA